MSRTVGRQTLKGHRHSADRSIASCKESEAQSRFEVAVAHGLDAAGGARSKNWACCSERWEQAKDGEGQVVLLSGEPGIGKSRLVQELKEQVEHEGATRMELRCSPYHQNSAFYPIIEHLQRLLQFAARGDAASQARQTPADARAAIASPRLIRCRCWPPCSRCPILQGAPPLTLSPAETESRRPRKP